MSSIRIHKGDLPENFVIGFKDQKQGVKNWEILYKNDYQPSGAKLTIDKMEELSYLDYDSLTAGTYTDETLMKAVTYRSVGAAKEVLQIEECIMSQKEWFDM